jgi:hypothetical protein
MKPLLIVSGITLLIGVIGMSIFLFLGTKEKDKKLRCLHWSSLQAEKHHIRPSKHKKEMRHKKMPPPTIQLYANKIYSSVNQLLMKKRKIPVNKQIKKPLTKHILSVNRY